MLKEAAARLIDITKSEKPEDVFVTDDGETANVTVTVDGTWQKRGNSSKLGVVFIISVRTGEVCAMSTSHMQMM